MTHVEKHILRWIVHYQRFVVTRNTGKQFRDAAERMCKDGILDCAPMPTTRGNDGPVYFLPPPLFRFDDTPSLPLR